MLLIPLDPGALAPVLASWLGLALLALWCLRLSLGLRALGRVSLLDPLTGLPNGRLFESERWPALLRSSTPLAVLYIDLDHLKLHNDRFGRLVGDRYIVRAASVLRNACRRGVDEVFRLHTAGDEFVVLVSGGDAMQARLIANNLLERLRREGLSASIGVVWTQATTHAARAALLLEAERAMRQAKTMGKGRVVVGCSSAGAADADRAG